MQKKVTIVFFAASILLVTGGFVWSYSSLRGIAQPLVLHFNELVGITQNGSFMNLVAVFVISMIALGVNFMLAMEIQKYNTLLSKTITYVSMGFSILLFIGFKVIIAVN